MITAEEFTERLGRLGADRGPRAFPRRRRDREILMMSVLLLLDSSRSYTEPQINRVLQRWGREVAPAIETDHVTLRRILVDHGLLERTADGRAYRVGFPPRAVAFALEVYDLDPRAAVAAWQQAQARRQAERRRSGRGRRGKGPGPAS